ncbi:hypothetical protein BVI434_370023 [Burkholderia vietnamiensis]|nr:hypothetical protein BVI434_370023 [Burkholderia vietnamiensis]
MITFPMLLVRSSRRRGRHATANGGSGATRMALSDPERSAVPRMWYDRSEPKSGRPNVEMSNQRRCCN